MHNSSDKYSPRELRHLDYISQFTVDVKYIKRERNIAADALSHSNIDVLHTDKNIDLEIIAKDQAVDNEFQKCLQTNFSDLKFQYIPLHSSDINIWCDISSGFHRPFVPEKH